MASDDPKEPIVGELIQRKDHPLEHTTRLFNAIVGLYREGVRWDYLPEYYKVVDKEVKAELEELELESLRRKVWQIGERKRLHGAINELMNTDDEENIGSDAKKKARQIKKQIDEKFGVGMELRGWYKDYKAEKLTAADDDLSEEDKVILQDSLDDAQGLLESKLNKLIHGDDTDDS